jgi:hypothetical protein
LISTKISISSRPQLNSFKKIKGIFSEYSILKKNTKYLPMRRLTNYLNKPLYGVSKNASANSKFIGSTLLASVIATGFYLKNQKTMLLTQFNDIQNAALVDETQPESGLSPAQEKVKEAIVYTRELNEVCIFIFSYF